MSEVNRRSFFKKASVGVAAASAMVVLPAAAMAQSEQAATLNTATINSAVTSSRTPLVAYISDPMSGEVTLMLGEREVLFRDAELVARLVKAAQ